MRANPVFQFAVLTVLVGLGVAGCRSEPASPERGASGSAAKTTAPALSPQAERSDLIPVGEVAPDFSAVDQDGRQVRLSTLLERGPVALIFYPKDFTSVCTKQLCAVRDDWSAFQRRGATVLGINPAEVATHAKFAADYRFPFAVLSDEGSRIASAYGCRGPQMNIRTVYVIGRGGKVLLAERGVVPHEKVFAALDAQ